MKRTRPVRRLQVWQREFVYGWVVQLSKVRDKTGRNFVCDPTPTNASGLTTNLLDALWFDNEQRSLAERKAFWQVGIVKQARRDTVTGMVELVYPVEPERKELI